MLIMAQLNEQSQLKINWTWSALKPADISSTASRQSFTQFFEHPERIPTISLQKIWLQRIGLLTLADLELLSHKRIHSKSKRPVPTSNFKKNKALSTSPSRDDFKKQIQPIGDTLTRGYKVTSPSRIRKWLAECMANGMKLSKCSIHHSTHNQIIKNKHHATFKALSQSPDKTLQCN